MKLPFEGITVISIEQAIAAPLATRHLADWGARVIKIERTGEGDFARKYDKAMHGVSSQFAWANRSKESLELDIKSEFGQDVLEELLQQADVFIQNLAPGAAEKVGLNAAALVKRYPRLVACDISGYGSSGPYSRKKAYDLLVQCETGFLSINGTPTEMAKCGLSIVDIATGMYALNGILTGLYRRERTGEGTAFEVSLFDAMTEWMSYPAYFKRDSGKDVARAGTRHATIAPYGPFRAGDGKTVFFGIQNEREWKSFCEDVLEDPLLVADPRFCSNVGRVSNRDKLEELINERLAAWTSDVIMERLERAAVANARLKSIEEFLEHPQLHERGRIKAVGSEVGPLEMFLPPVIFHGLEPVMNPIPAMGQHTESILKELGFQQGPKVAAG